MIYLSFLQYFDPNLLDVCGSFLAVAFKYAGFIGIVSMVGRMIIKAFSGKERIF